MKQEGLVSNHMVEQFKSHVEKCNESKVENVVKREASCIVVANSLSLLNKITY